MYIFVALALAVTATAGRVRTSGDRLRGQSAGGALARYRNVRHDWLRLLAHAIQKIERLRAGGDITKVSTEVIHARRTTRSTRQ